MKEDPGSYLTEAEKYLYYLWEPEVGHAVVYHGDIYTIKEIMGDQVALNEIDRLLWIQDVGWKPTLEDCDSLITRYHASIVSDGQIRYRKDKQNCFFKRPDTLEEYIEVISQLRALNKFKMR